MRLRTAHPASCRERTIWPTTFAASILPKLRNGAGTNLDIAASSEAAGPSHAVVVPDLAAPRTMQDEVIVRLAATPIEHKPVWVLAKPSEIRAVAIFEDLHLR